LESLGLSLLILSGIALTGFFWGEVYDQFSDDDAPSEPDDDGGPADDILTGTAGDDNIQGFKGNDLIAGWAGDDTLDGGQGSDRIYGNEGDDVIYGRQSYDRLHGGDGNDELYGGWGNDRVFGNDGEDRLNGDQGDDLLDGGAGDDSLRGDMGDDVLMGGAGDDFLDGSYGNDILYGGEGDDYLTDWSGQDELHGGNGNDTLVAGSPSGAQKLFGDDGDDLIYLKDGGEATGGDGSDTFLIRAHNFTNSSNVINDYTDGEDRIAFQIFDEAEILGIDITGLPGGAGESVTVTLKQYPTDTIRTVSADVLGVTGLQADDISFLRETRTTPDFSQDLTFQTNVFGTAGDDDLGPYTENVSIEALAGDDQVRGNGDTLFANLGAGNDSFFSGGGDERVLGGDGNDTFIGQNGAGTAIFKGGDGNDDFVIVRETTRVDGSAGDDTITIAAGNGGNVDTSVGYKDIGFGSHRFDIRGGNGDDTFIGGDGNDLFLGEGGADTMFGGGGDDQLFGFGNQPGVESGGDILDGGSGSDLIIGGFGADILSGGAGDDLIIGSGHSGLFGVSDGTGAAYRAYNDGETDTLSGGDGNDILVLGTNDIATGGAGEDRFEIRQPFVLDSSISNVATVTDFNQAEDQLSIVYERDFSGYSVNVVDFADGTGADIFVNGDLVAKVTGAQGLSASSVLIENAADATHFRNG
jgi:Ca2+-binding RTX toxin-like protein